MHPVCACTMMYRGRSTTERRLWRKEKGFLLQFLLSLPGSALFAFLKVEAFFAVCPPIRPHPGPSQPSNTMNS